MRWASLRVVSMSDEMRIMSKTTEPQLYIMIVVDVAGCITQYSHLAAKRLKARKPTQELPER